jgi:hypothetical protein
MSREQQGVVQLPAAGVPADGGLSSLGLVMQLGGTLMALVVSLYAFGRLLTMADKNEALWIFLLLATCIARSIIHRMAGTELLYGRASLDLDNPPSPLAGLYRYIAVGLVHSVVVAIAMKLLFKAPASLAIGMGIGLAVWPGLLAGLVAAGHFAPYNKKIAMSEDKGFEGASILMTVLGICGILVMATTLLAMFELGGKALRDGSVILVMLSMVLLLVRSVLHFQAGVTGLRTTSIDRSVELANRYASFGVVSSFCAGGALLLVTMMGALDITMLAAVTAITWMLMTWPMIIRRFFGERQFADLMAGENADVHRRSPDAGLTGLGWLLIGHAAYTATMLIPQMIGSDLGALDKLWLLGGSANELRSPWWNVGICMFQGWAGFELIRMSAHHRLIASLYAGVTAAVTVYMYWPMLKLLEHMSKTQLLSILPVAIALVIPVSVFVLVNRNLTPTARARFRPK